MAEFLAIGDTHYSTDKGTGGISKYVENYDEFISNEIRKILSYGKKHGITNIIFLGDICDSPRFSYEAMLAFIKLIKENSSFQFYAILGNHDLMSTNPDVGHSMEVVIAANLPNLKIYTKPTVEVIDGCKVNFMPWPSKAFKKDCLNIAHIEVSGSSHDGLANRKFENTQATGTDTDSQYSTSNAVAIIGHLHNMHRVRNSYYPGSPVQNNFGESLTKYFAHVQFNSIEDYSIELISTVPEYRLHTVVVNSINDLKNVSKNPKDLIKLVINDGADVSLADYYDWPNVVMVKAYKSKTELQSILTEDLINGQELEIKNFDYFNKWVHNQNLEPDLIKRTIKLRAKILDNSNL